MTKPAQEIPENTHGCTSTTVTTRVKRYKMMTLTTHERSPNVRILIGINNMDKSGRTRNTRTERIKPAINRLCQLPRMTIPAVSWLVIHSAKTWKRKDLTIRFITSLIVSDEGRRGQTIAYL